MRAYAYCEYVAGSNASFSVPDSMAAGGRDIATRVHSVNSGADDLADAEGRVRRQ